MRRVILESPYAGNFITRFLNRRYARKCLRDALARNDAPIASHLLYTQRGVLDDSVIEEREVGIHAGLIWGAVADATVVYIDRGVSHGMNRGIKRAMLEGRPVEFRSLDPELEKRLVIHREIKGTC